MGYHQAPITPHSPGVDLVDILNEVNEGRIVVIVAQDEASMSLGGEAKRSLEQIGSTLIHQLGKLWTQ